MAALLVFCNIKELHCRHIELHPTPHKTFRLRSTLHTTMLLTVNVTIRNHSIENTTQGSIAGIADASGPVTGQSTRSCTRDPIAIVGVEQIAVTAVHSTTLVAVHSTQTRVPPFWVNNCCVVNQAQTFWLPSPASRMLSWLVYARRKCLHFSLVGVCWP